MEVESQNEQEIDLQSKISLKDLKARISGNYDKLIVAFKHLVVNLKIEKRIEGEIIASSLMTNNASLIAIYIQELLEDLELLENMISKLVNYFALNKSKEAIKKSVDELQQRVISLMSLIISENCS